MNQSKRPVRAKKWLLILLCAGMAAIVSGCQTLSFYAQAIKGEYQILAREEPIKDLIADQHTPGRLKQQLQLVEELRSFAAKDLKLPVDKHYHCYADVDRPFVVWNVQAAPEFSLQPKTWWYPIVGSLEYRGYFAESNAQNYARKVRAKGFDVYLDGVEAYSTLGWFNDPVLNTFVYRQEPYLAEVIFHELGHRRVFARGDTDFNEAFATTVGQEGTRRWLLSSGNAHLFEQYLGSLTRNDQFVHLIMKTRERLLKLFGDTLDEDGKVKAARQPPASPEKLRREKQQMFEDLRIQYAELKAGWDGYSGYDDWFGKELNNAQLNTIANYYDYVPGFEQLLKLNGGDLEKFYQAAEDLADLSRDKRHQRLRELARP